MGDKLTPSDVYVALCPPPAGRGTSLLIRLLCNNFKVGKCKLMEVVSSKRKRLVWVVKLLKQSPSCKFSSSYTKPASSSSSTSTPSTTSSSSSSRQSWAFFKVNFDNGWECRNGAWKATYLCSSFRLNLPNYVSPLLPILSSSHFIEIFEGFFGARNAFLHFYVVRSSTVANIKGMGMVYGGHHYL